jgi:hypothetical protein
MIECRSYSFQIAQIKTSRDPVLIAIRPQRIYSAQMRSAFVSFQERDDSKLASLCRDRTASADNGS